MGISRMEQMLPSTGHYVKVVACPSNKLFINKYVAVSWKL